jgi:hypothetical protein
MAGIRAGTGGAPWGRAWLESGRHGKQQEGAVRAEPRQRGPGRSAGEQRLEGTRGKANRPGAMEAVRVWEIRLGLKLSRRAKKFTGAAAGRRASHGDGRRAP